jgi:ferric-dicitrate binding protein FerR (iron transport regulator)
MAVVSSREPGSSDEVGLRGRLEQFALPTVLTFLDLERRSGELTLFSKDDVGRVWLRQGRVIRARIEGSRRIRRSALYDLMSWTEGRFAFRHTDVADVADEIGASTTMILLDAARRADESAATNG